MYGNSAKVKEQESPFMIWCHPSHMPILMQQSSKLSRLKHHVISKNAESEGQDSPLLVCYHHSHCKHGKKSTVCSVSRKAQQPVGLPRMQNIEEQDSPHRFIAIIAQILIPNDMQGQAEPLNKRKCMSDKAQQPGLQQICWLMRKGHPSWDLLLS